MPQQMMPTMGRKKSVVSSYRTSVLYRLKPKDITILMGDFDAKIGDDNTEHEEVMGKQMNENVELFADVCAGNRQLVTGIIAFPHKLIHKATWRSQDYITENQTDHVCVWKRFRRSLQEVIVRRGTDVASDHHLVLATLKLHLKRHRSQTSSTVRYKVDLLKTK